MTETIKRKLHLLLVEDSEDDEFLLLRHLKKSGYEVTHRRVETDPDMREALASGTWDLIISDYSMPRFSGLKALEVYKELDCDLPFIIVSGTIGEETAVKALRSGAHDFILKGKYARLLPAMDRELREFRSRKARKLAERKLAEQELHFRSLIEKALDIITIVSEDGTVLYTSPATERILGYKPSEVVGQRLQELVHAQDKEALNANLAEALKNEREVHNVTLRFRRRDGEIRFLESIGRNLLGDPTVTGIVLNSRDITEQQRAELALRQANARLSETLTELKQSQGQAIQQERLIALGAMASGIAHDFNNALTSILGFSEALLMYPEILEDQEQSLELIQMMNTAAQDGAGVVSRLSEFYRHREKDEKFAAIDLARITEQTLSLTKPKWSGQAQAAGVHITIEQSFEAVPPVMGNEQELRQALTNLIFNAVDAMPEGGTLSLSTKSQGDFVLLEISDSGIGMDEETKRRCLEPFFTTKGQKGTGMGLSMVYGILKRHQALVEIDSESGRGTTFRLTFPTELSEETSVDQVCLDAPDLSNRSLMTLVVESEPMVSKVISTFLLCDGHQVKTATSGSEGLEIFRQHQNEIDLVVAAEAIPGLSGHQLAETISLEHPGTPVILLTSLGGERPESTVGVTQILSKPFTLKDFRQAKREAVWRENS